MLAQRKWAAGAARRAGIALIGGWSGPTALGTHRGIGMVVLARWSAGRSSAHRGGLVFRLGILKPEQLMHPLTGALAAIKKSVPVFISKLEHCNNPFSRPLTHLLPLLQFLERSKHTQRKPPPPPPVLHTYWQRAQESWNNGNNGLHLGSYQERQRSGSIFEQITDFPKGSSSPLVNPDFW